MKQASSLAGFVDRQQVLRRFSRAAPSYAAGDFLAREIDQRMQGRLDFVRLEPTRVLDLGCSQGASLRALAQRYPAAALFGVDLSPAMLQTLRPSGSVWRRWLGLSEARPIPLVGDAEALPLATNSMSLVWSNLLLHWLDDPRPALAESHRVLETGGLLMFSTLGPDTLKELRAAFADGYAHTQRFTDMHDLGDMLLESGFADPVMDMETIHLTYPDLDGLFADLRAGGSACAMHARRHSLTGRGRLAAVRAAYEKMRVDGRLPATIEVVYGHAWKAAPRQDAEGRSIIRFAPKPPAGDRPY